jgi:Putative adhesin
MRGWRTSSTEGLVTKAAMKWRTTLVFLILILSSTVTPAHPDKREEKGRGQQIERAIATEVSVSVSACLNSGSITVHGWDRSEVRARSSEAADIAFKRIDETTEGQPARKISLLVMDKMRRPRKTDKCESSGELELDVPRGAAVQLQTGDSDINVFDVATVYVSTENGDVEIEHATRTVDAGTIGGSISLKNSSGSISLHSVGGSIDASDVHPAEAGDAFEARSVGGDVSLTRISNAQLKGRTLNGTLCFTGPLAHEGRYDLQTISGDLTVSLPPDSSFKLIARFSQSADVITDFPLTLTPVSPHPLPAPAPRPAATPEPQKLPPGPVTAPEPKAPPEPASDEDSTRVIAKVRTGKKTSTVVLDVPGFGSRRVEGIHGNGDALLSLASFSGTIHIKKHQ